MRDGYGQEVSGLRAKHTTIPKTPELTMNIDVTVSILTSTSQSAIPLVKSSSKNGALKTSAFASAEQTPLVYQ